MFGGNNTTIGLDLGTTGVRAVEMAWRGGKPVVERWGAADFTQPVTDWRNSNTDEVMRLIGDCTARKGMRGHWVAHSVCGESVAPQYFNFPQLMPEDVAEAVRIEVETALPFRVEEALISYVLFRDLRQAQGKARTHGLAIAADGSLVESRLIPIRKAGLEVFCVETDATACANAFVATHGAQEQGTTALMDIGHRYSSLGLLTGEGTLLVRDVPWAGDQITRAIATLLTIEPAEAEALKRKHWEEGPAGAAPLGERMDEVLESDAKEFAARVRDTIEYWVGERLVPPLAHMYLTGGGSQVRGLPECLSQGLGVPVERWSPFAQSLPKTPGTNSWDHRMNVAFGLALRSFAARNNA